MTFPRCSGTGRSEDLCCFLETPESSGLLLSGQSGREALIFISLAVSHWFSCAPASHDTVPVILSGVAASQLGVTACFSAKTNFCGKKKQSVEHVQHAS